MSSNEEFEENSKRLGIEQIETQKDFVIEDPDPEPEPATEEKEQVLSQDADIDRMGEIVEMCDHRTAVKMIKREFSGIQIGLLVDMVRTIQTQSEKIDEQRDLIRSSKMAFKKQRAKMLKLEVRLHPKNPDGYFSS